jgi:hypothetical protein
MGPVVDDLVERRDERLDGVDAGDDILLLLNSLAPQGR